MYRTAVNIMIGGLMDIVYVASIYVPTLPPSEAKSICNGESLIELLSTPLDGAGDGDLDPMVNNDTSNTISLAFI